MRRTVTSLAPLAFALALAASGAQAADFQRTDTGPYGADFSGVELGPDLGAALGAASSANISGPAGGAHIGYNFQANRVVGGVEGDAMFSAIRSGSFGGASFDQTFLSSARVRGGYAFGNFLPYGTLGWAWSTTDFHDNGANSSESVRGVVFGVGGEYAITRNVTLRAELLRYDFGSANYATPFASQQLATSTNVVRVGGSVHF
jgi:outer membrane immunogenic protein